MESGMNETGAAIFYRGESHLAFIPEYFFLFLPLWCPLIPLRSGSSFWTPGLQKPLLGDYAHLDSSCIFAGMWELRSVQPYAVGLDNGSHSKVKWFLAQCFALCGNEQTCAVLCF